MSDDKPPSLKSVALSDTNTSDTVEMLINDIEENKNTCCLISYKWCFKHEGSTIKTVH